MTIDDKDRIDGFLRLAEFRTHRRDTRRTIEWRVSLAIWALLAATAYSLKSPPEGVLPIVFLMAVVAIHGLLLLVPIWASNKLDIEIAFYYTEMAEKILIPESSVRKRPQPLGGLEKFSGAAGDWGVRFEILATVVIALGVYIFGGTFSK